MTQDTHDDGNGRITLAVLKNTVELQGKQTHDALARLEAMLEQQCIQQRIDHDRISKIEARSSDNHAEIEKLRGRDTLLGILSAILATLAGGAAAIFGK
jgi:hypothetical protein